MNPDEYRLEDIVRDHSIGAGVFIPFAVTRLRSNFGETEVTYGLEVSGTTTEEVEARHRIKIRRLRENPYGVDGYVVVVGFATREVIFSFHRFEEIG